MQLSLIGSSGFHFYLPKRANAACFLGYEPQSVLLAEVPCNFYGSFLDVFRTREKCHAARILAEPLEDIRIFKLVRCSYQAHRINQRLGLSGQRQNLGIGFPAGIVGPVTDDNQSFRVPVSVLQMVQSRHNGVI